MRKRWVILVAFIFVFFSFNSFADVKLKIVAVNPSTTESRIILIKTYLPKQVEPDDILEKGDFIVDYDFDQSLYYVYQDLELEPKETRKLGIAIRNIWVVPKEELAAYSTHVEKILEVLKGTQYYEQAEILAESIYKRINDISLRQGRPGVKVEERISEYETHLSILKEIKKDIGVLEDLSIEVGGLPGDKVLGENQAERENIHAQTPEVDFNTANTVTLKIEVRNPFKEQRSLSVKRYLPKEVKQDYIINHQGLSLGYDYKKGVHYVENQAIELTPGEKQVFSVEIKDVWVIPHQRLQTLRSHTLKLMEMLKDTSYWQPGKFLGERAINLLDVILNSQLLPVTNVAAHIGEYRKNLGKYDDARADIAKLERLVIQAGGSPGITLISQDVKIKQGGVIPAGGKIKEELLRGAKGVEMAGKIFFRGKAPDKISTWRVIWMIIGFLGTLSFLFFALWWTQIKIKQRRDVEN